MTGGNPRRLPGTEEVEFNGRRYRRHPDHPRRHRRVYFMATTAPRNYLHRDVYEASFGPIPPAHDIHHLDENPNNNDPSNLAPITRADHRRLHHQTDPTFTLTCHHCGRSYESIREWSLWCSSRCKRAARVKAGLVPPTPRKGPWREGRRCEECEVDFVAKVSWQRFCTSRCKQRFSKRRTGT